MSERDKEVRGFRERLSSCLESEESRLNKKKSISPDHLSKIIRLCKTILEYCRKVHTAEDVMHARAKEKRKAGDDLMEWKRGYIYDFKKRKRGDLVAAAMFGVMSVDSRSERIPWSYFDFINKRLYHSPAAMKLLGFGSTRTESDLRALLSYFERKERIVIENSLKSGKGLSHYEAKTSRKYENEEKKRKAKKLELSTYPFYYPRESTATGVAIFLQDPKISLHSLGLRKFEEKIKKTANEMLEQLAEEQRRKIYVSN